jgi:hypothetical protein
MKTILTQRFKTIINPDFLKNLDRDFLLNRPTLWVLKIHYIIYYSLLLNLLFLVVVCISPISYGNLQTYLNLGLWIVAIGELILLAYWWYRQFVFSVDKRLTYTKKSNAFLEILGYFICIMLIALPLLVFSSSIHFLQVPKILPREEISIDLIILETAVINVKPASNPDLKKYFQEMKAGLYLDKEVLKTLQKESIFLDKYDFYKYYKKNRQELTPLQECIVEDNNTINSEGQQLRKFLKDSITNREDLILLEYDIINNTENYYYMCNIYKYLQSIKGEQLLKQKIKLVDWIRKNEVIDKITPIINKYIQQNKNVNVRSLINALNKAQTDYRKYYESDSDFVKTWRINYIVITFLSIGVFLFRNTYSIDFIYGIVYVFCLILILFIIASSSPLLEVDAKKFPFDRTSIELVIFIYLPTLFISYQIISSVNSKKYSRFKVLNLIAFPFAIVSSFLSLRYLLPEQAYKIFGLNEDFTNDLYNVLAYLSYLPFIHYLKNQLIKQLTLPKD